MSKLQKSLNKVCSCFPLLLSALHWFTTDFDLFFKNYSWWRLKNHLYLFTGLGDKEDHPTLRKVLSCETIFVCGKAQTKELSKLLLVVLLFLLLLGWFSISFFKNMYIFVKEHLYRIWMWWFVQNFKLCNQYIWAKVLKNDFNIICNFDFLIFKPSKKLQNSNLTWSAQNNLGVHKLFICINFLIWALLVVQFWLLFFKMPIPPTF